MTFDETIAKSAELDRLLSGKDERTMPEIGGKQMVGEIGSMFADVRKMLAEAKLGMAGAVTELMEEVKDLKHVETHVRGETKAVRDFKASILGNATAGENQEPEK